MAAFICAICIASFEQCEQIVCTECGHQFHTYCLKMWFKRSKTCPQCRHQLSKDTVIRVYPITSDCNELPKSRGQLIDFYKKDSTIKIKKLQIDIKSLEISISNLKIKNAEQVQKLQDKIDSMEEISAILTSTSADVEKMLQVESDRSKLCTYAAILKRSLRNSEAKEMDLRNLLRVTTANYKREMEEKRLLEMHNLDLESECRQLKDKVKISSFAVQKKETSNIITTYTTQRKLLLPSLQTSLNKSFINTGAVRKPSSVVGEKKPRLALSAITSARNNVPKI